MKIVTAAEMRAIDAGCGVPSMILMENAAAAAARSAIEMLPDPSAASLLIVAGRGNNGGDGIAMARMLLGKIKRVRVVAAFDAGDLKGDAAEQYRRALDAGVPVTNDSDLEQALGACDMVVDALLGTGFTPKPLPARLSNVIATANRAAIARKIPMLSVDVPSGVCSDTGRVLGEAIRATRTITFGRPKRGLFLYPAAEHVGRLICDGIGIDEAFFHGVPGELPDDAAIARLLPHRRPTAHKGDARVLVAGGAEGMSGAVLLAAKAALRTGAGYVYAAMPAGNSDTGAVIEAVRVMIPGDTPGRFGSAAAAEIASRAARVHAAAIGGGFGIGETEGRVLGELMRTIAVPTVVDADALRQTRPEDFARAPHRILTPHAGEFAMLFGGTVEENELDRVGRAIEAARACRQTVLYKGRPTIVAGPDGRYSVNPTGSELLATCGSGDVLSGIIAGLLAQGVPPWDAARAGAYLHGRTAELWGRPVGMTADDVTNLLPDAWASIERDAAQ